MKHVGYGRKPEVQCHKCHGFGHFADYCSTPDALVDVEWQCEECDGYGHKGEECPNWGGYNTGYESQRPKHKGKQGANKMSVQDELNGLSENARRALSKASVGAGGCKFSTSGDFSIYKMKKKNR